MDRKTMRGVPEHLRALVEQPSPIRPRSISCDKVGFVEPATLWLRIDGPPVGKNRRHYKTKRLTEEAREYLARVKRIGFAAAKLAGWRCVSDPRCLEITVSTYNTKHDDDAALPIVRDGLEGVIYDNDRSLWRSISEARTDNFGARVEVKVRHLRPDAVSSPLS